MDIIKELGVRGIGSYLKRVVEYMLNEVKSVYKEFGIEIEPSWLPFFVAINSKNGISIKEIADLTNVTHSAASQAVNNMKSKKIIETKENAEDKRVQLIYITEYGKKELVKLMPVCDAIKESVEKRFEATGYNILEVIEKMENELRKESVSREVIEKLKKKNQEKIEMEFEKTENKNEGYLKYSSDSVEKGRIFYKKNDSYIEITGYSGNVLEDNEKTALIIGEFLKFAEKSGIGEVIYKVIFKENNIINRLFKNGFEADSVDGDKIIFIRRV